MKPVIIHSLAHALAVAMQEAVAQTAPGAASYAGVGYLLAMRDEAGIPPERFILDCGDDPAVATAALRMGAGCLRVALPPEMLNKIQEIAKGKGVPVLTGPAETLDLLGAHDPGAAVRRWLGR